MAMILASFAKPMLLLMMIWRFPFPLNFYIDIFILLSNIVALNGRSFRPPGLYSRASINTPCYVLQNCYVPRLQPRY